MNIFFLDLVLSCISSLRKVLSDHDYNLVHSKYFAMFHDSQSGEHGMSDWEKFIKASLKLLGFPESSLKSLKVCLFVVFFERF